MTLEEVSAIIRPVVEELGYETVDIAFKKEYGADTLTVFIYKKGGVELTDCEKVTSALDPILDELDFGNDGYNFNVSSPGLDRPIVTPDDYRRNEGEDVEILFKIPQGKKKSVHGVLKEYAEEKITLILSNGKEMTFEKNNASVVRPYVSFK